MVRTVLGIILFSLICSVAVHYWDVGNPRIRTLVPVPMRTKQLPVVQNTPPQAAPPIEMPYLTTLEQKIFSEINVRRRENGLKDLTWYGDLTKVARAHSNNMISRKFFDHTDPIAGSLDARLGKLGFPSGTWLRCGENILMESRTPDAVKGAVDGWMNSPGHRKNILNPNFTHTSVGAALASNNILYLTQVFMYPNLSLSR